ncbi:MAG: Epoxyqueuosine reductase [Chloroflexi bacterium ADurb.Bin360]|nr:MAG: Epoxyqueuosine reductase [Chloroflexi bacterium ADurb.Bin360]
MDDTGTLLRSLAAAANLDWVGFAPVGAARTWESYRAWLAQGYAGAMEYLARPDALARRADPRALMPSAKSVIVAAAGYTREALPPLLPLHGRVARYAWGADYHRWVLQRLEQFTRLLAEALGHLEARCYVDTGPILEREWAVTAGVGWQGKNTCLLNPQLGSFFFLGVILADRELQPAPVPDFPTCGSCTRCLDACPTGALIAPGVLDARRCLSYLTIEHRGAIPEPFRSLMGEHVFGCDICQEVCPWNQRAQVAPKGIPDLSPFHTTLVLPELLSLNAEEFRARFRPTALWRATPEGLARNAAVVLGNLRDPAASPVLEWAAREHSSALVREHAAWALSAIPNMKPLT